MESERIMNENSNFNTLANMLPNQSLKASSRVNPMDQSDPNQF